MKTHTLTKLLVLALGVFVGAAKAPGGTITFSNYGPGEGFIHSGPTVIADGYGPRQDVATPFSFAVDGELTHIHAQLSGGNVWEPPGLFLFSIFSDSGAGAPGTARWKLATVTTTPGDFYTGVDLTFSDGPLLKAGEQYWLVAKGIEGSAGWFVSNAPGLPEGLVLHNGAWVEVGDAPAVSISITTVPDAFSTLCLLGIATMGVGIVLRREQA